ncbi:MAG: hypothetical protein PHC41_07125 [Lachnospiraceae bacterium]|nr:hypothetical protein [Lachnospiraceae bacterium]MDD3615985.1 hypothetical protein [Lachnospiraceae bacterium]
MFIAGQDGVELIRSVRSDVKHRHIAIITNTQFGEPMQEECTTQNVLRRI